MPIVTSSGGWTYFSFDSLTTLGIPARNLQFKRTPSYLKLFSFLFPFLTRVLYCREMCGKFDLRDSGRLTQFLTRTRNMAVNRRREKKGILYIRKYAGDIHGRRRIKAECRIEKRGGIRIHYSPLQRAKTYARWMMFLSPDLFRKS